jgi:hypothetical protein
MVVALERREKAEYFLHKFSDHTVRTTALIFPQLPIGPSLSARYENSLAWSRLRRPATWWPLIFRL